MIGRWCAFAASLLLAFVATSAPAQDYPSRPIRIVVPFSPGGAVDGPMRVIAQEMSKRLGAGVIDLFTFPFDFPDENKAPLLEPEYVWQKPGVKYAP